MKKKRIRLLCWILTPIIFLILSIYNSVGNVPTTIFIRDGQEFHGSHLIKLVEDKDIKVTNIIKNDNNIRKAKVSFLGIVQLKSVAVKSIPSEITLYPGGQPVGVKLSTKGVLVVALSDIENESGKNISPGAVSGIQVGDSIIKINNVADRDVMGEELLDVSRVAFGAVAHKYFVGCDVGTVRAVVMLRDSLAQEGIALLGSVAPKRRIACHLVGRRVEGGDAGRGQRARHIPDA
jgi:hypothetical protein